MRPRERRAVLGPEAPPHAVDLGSGDSDPRVKIIVDALVDARDHAEALRVERIVQVEEKNRHRAIVAEAPHAIDRRLDGVSDTSAGSRRRVRGS